MPYLTVFYRLILRPLRNEPIRTLLTALAVGLGVSVVLAIEMAGEAAAGSFQSSFETLAGDADLEITANGGVPPQAVAALATAPHLFEIQPRMEDYATVVPTGQTVAVIGIDVLSDSVARAPSVTIQQDNATTDTKSLESFDSVWVGPELGKKNGERLQLVLNDREQSFVVRGVLPKEAADVVIMDLSAAARAFGRGDSLDRILVRTPRGTASKDWQSVVSALVPAGRNRFQIRGQNGREPPDARGVPLESPSVELHRADRRRVSHLQHHLCFGSSPPCRDRHPRAHWAPRARRSYWHSSVKLCASDWPGASSGSRSGGCSGAECRRTGGGNGAIAVRQQPSGSDRIDSHLPSQPHSSSALGVAVLSALAPSLEAAQVAPVERWLEAAASMRCACHSLRATRHRGHSRCRGMGGITAGAGRREAAVWISRRRAADCGRLRSRSRRLVSAVCSGRCASARAVLRCRSAARGTKPRRIFAKNVGAGRRTHYGHRDDGRSRHHGWQFSRDGAAVDGRPPAGRPVSSACGTRVA